MLNIFNLFLFLLLFWTCLMIGSGHFSWLYIIWGIIFSFLTSFISFKAKLINRDSELLYLSFGFYRYFSTLYLQNFLNAMKLIINLALSKKTIRPLVFSISANEEPQFNPALMIVSLNMSAGLFCISSEEKIFLVHAIDEKYFVDFDLYKTKKILPEINDDNLV